MVRFIRRGGLILTYSNYNELEDRTFTPIQLNINTLSQKGFLLHDQSTAQMQLRFVVLYFLLPAN